MAYWVNEDFPTSTARIHRGECGHCNYGQGRGIRPGKGTSQWHGSFETKGAALAFARTNTKCRDVLSCQTCNP